MEIERGILQNRVEKALRILKNCSLCPRNCGVDRTSGEKGFCKGGRRAKVASFNSHFGEEPPISGYKGSGTIFFSFCTMRCLFCQNYPISQQGSGKEVEKEELAEMMLDLQKRGCHNINLVTPTHFVPQILESLSIASDRGLNIPIVYNTSGYESIETLRILDGVVDIYMPDIKYGSNRGGRLYSGVDNYWDVVRPAIKEMHRQVGDLTFGKDRVAKKGLLIRHLVLPNNLAESKNVLEFISDEVSPLTYLSLMAQYFPANKAYKYSELSRRITKEEYAKIVNVAESLGLKNCLLQMID